MKNKLLIICLLLNVLLANDLEKVRYFAQKGNYPRAITLLENMIQKDSQNPHYYFELGKIYSSLSMNNESISCFKKVVTLDSTNIMALAELGKAYKKCEKYNEAVITLTRVLQIQPDNINIKKMLGELFFEKKQYANARKIYRELSEIDFLKNTAIVNIGLCEMRLGNVEEAIINFEQAYKEKPMNLQIVLLLSHAYTLNTDYIKAENLLKYELEKYPLNQKLLNEYARILFRNRRYKLALEFFGKLQEDSETDWERYQKMGMCCYYLDKPKYAEMMLQVSMQKDSTNYLTNFYLGLTKMDLEKWQDAEEYLTNAILLSTPSFMSEAYMRKALCFENLGNYEASLENYQLASKTGPHREEMHYYIATLIDQYFDDENLALEKYRYFLENCNDCDVRMKNYAESRVEQIREKQIFSREN